MSHDTHFWEATICIFTITIILEWERNWMRHEFISNRKPFKIFYLRKKSKPWQMKDLKIIWWILCAYLRVEMKIHIMYSLSSLTCNIYLKKKKNKAHIFRRLDYLFHSAMMQEWTYQWHWVSQSTGCTCLIQSSVKQVEIKEH